MKIGRTAALSEASVQLFDLDHLSKGRMIPHVSSFMNRTSHCASLVVFAIALSFAFSRPLAVAQSPPPEKPKLRDCGSSVRKLKWDPELNAPVEINSADGRARRSEDDDVVRIE